MNSPPKKSSFMRMIINKRLFLVYLLIISVFVLLMSRLFFLQVVKGDEYASTAENNTYRVISLPARRGDIVDVEGTILASSIPEMSLKVYLEEVGDKEARLVLAEELAALFNRPEIYDAEVAARKERDQTSITAEIAKANGLTEEQYLAGETATDADGETTPVTAEDEDEDKELTALTLDRMATTEMVDKILTSATRSYEGVTLYSYTYDVGVQVAQIIAENKEKYPGVSVVEEPKRDYPNGYYLGHVLGTIGAISQSQYEELKDAYGYKLTDILGKSGLEGYYERYNDNNTEIGLRGTAGSRVVKVDTHSRVVSTISEESPKAGNTLTTTIHLGTQKVMEDSLKSVVARVQKTGISKCQAGAAVLLDVKTGAVRAMASYPSIDPNDFATGLTAMEANYYINSETLKPQLNRAIQAVYASGSTFKLVAATAILKGGIDVNRTVYCTPDAWADKSEGLASCWDIHYTVNFNGAVAGSCNTYFQKMAAEIGYELLLEVGRDYGFGQLTGIDLSGEVKGLLPTPEWKAERYADNQQENRWRIYDTYYTAIGQGATQDTVLQLASYTAAIANGGVRMQPYIVSKIEDENGIVLKEFTPQETGDVELTEEQSRILIKSMVGVVTEETGTARNLFDKLQQMGIMPAGKTGTAQTGVVGDDPNRDYHGVFIAFAPADDPEVAFASLIEYGRHGSTSAGLVAAATFEAYFGYDVDFNVIVSEDE